MNAKPAVVNHSSVSPFLSFSSPPPPFFGTIRPSMNSPSVNRWVNLTTKRTNASAFGQLLGLLFDHSAAIAQHAEVFLQRNVSEFLEKQWRVALDDVAH